jgi:flagellar hook-associated protein 2
MAGIRLGGIGSGLDTDQIIAQLMAIERRPVTLLQKRSDNLTAESNAWRDLNSRLLNLQTKLSNLLSASNWDAKKASVADASSVTVTAKSTAAVGTHTLSASLPTGTTWRSNLDVVDPDAALGLDGTMQIQSAGPSSGKTITVTAGDSLRSIIDRINGDASLGLSARLVDLGGSFRLEVSSRAGAANDFTLVDQAGSVGASLKILSSGPDSGIRTSTASDYRLTIDGQTFTSATNQFTEVLPGLDVTVLKEIRDPVVVTVENDDAALAKAAKDLVDQYNSVVDLAESLTKFDKNPEKSGPLAGDNLVRQIRDRIDSLLTGPGIGVAGKYTTLASVGIKMPEFKAGSEGISRRLSFDEQAFMAALKEDRAAVKQLIAAEETGIAVRAEAWLKEYTRTGGMIGQRMTAIESDLKLVKERMDRLDQVVLPAREARLRKEFTALDKALSLLHSQGEWLAAQIASLPRIDR